MKFRFLQKTDLIIPIDKLIGSNFLQLVTVNGKEILRLKPPFTLEFKPTINRQIFEKLSERVEKGGILACRPIQENTEKKLIVEKVSFIKNVAKDRYTSYSPHPTEWNNTMAEIILRDHLLPIEFHSHPISKRKIETKLGEYLNQMGTSKADQESSELIIQIGNYLVAVPQAILIKDVQTNSGFFVGIYGGLISPKNFEPKIIKEGTDVAIDLGKDIFSWITQQLSDPKRKSAIKIAAVIAAAIGLIFPKQTITFLAFLLTGGVISIKMFPLILSLKGKEMSHFGIANISNQLRVQIPEFDFQSYTLEELEIIKLKGRKK